MREIDFFFLSRAKGPFSVREHQFAWLCVVFSSSLGVRTENVDSWIDPGGLYLVGGRKDNGTKEVEDVCKRVVKMIDLN